MPALQRAQSYICSKRGSDEGFVDSPSFEAVVVDSPICDDVVADSPGFDDVVADSPGFDDVVADSPGFDDVVADSPDPATKCLLLSHGGVAESPNFNEVVAEDNGLVDDSKFDSILSNSLYDDTVVPESMLDVVPVKPQVYYGDDYAQIWGENCGPKCPKMRQHWVEAYCMWIPAAKCLLLSPNGGQGPSGNT